MPKPSKKNDSSSASDSSSEVEDRAVSKKEEKKQEKRKRKQDDSSDSGPDDRLPAKKPEEPKKNKKSEDVVSWDLGKKRFVKLDEFRGKWLVSIREFYEDDKGDLKPGKKGIALSLEQYQKFKSYIEEIDAAIERHT